ncbi:MAG: methyltransferase domain-containing protein [Burkholderiaceae bacterium]|nr:methyltransferase domain-containing protein [Burkholderiaceae bacterium]
MDNTPDAAGLDPTVRFSERAQAYASGRPSYPPQIASYLARELSLPPSAQIVDLGSGTGLSAQIFLQAGFRVIGVEPNAQMRAQADQLLSGVTGFTSVAGSAQATGLADASADCVIAAQAFHWFGPEEARTESLRILRPPPRAALIWNVRRTSESDFSRGYEQLLLEFGGEYPQIRERHTDEESIGKYFGGRQWHRADFPHATELDLELLAARVNSTSYLPAPSDRRYVPMMQAVRDLFQTNQRGGRVVMQYDTHVYLGVIQT